MKRNDSPVSSQTLRQGAWYALEQAGRLLASATCLADAGDWSTAVGLAMLGREELGRSRILEELAKDRDAGKSILRASDVNKLCESHESKQRNAVLSTPIRADSGSELGRQMHRCILSPPATEAWREARKYLDVATESKARRQHQDRVELRLHAFYVDLKSTGTRWQRPIEIDQGQARDELYDAVNDYSCALNRMRPDVVRETSPEMADVLEAMDPRPRILEPVWPKWTGSAG